MLITLDLMYNHTWHMILIEQITYFSTCNYTCLTKHITGMNQMGIICYVCSSIVSQNSIGVNFPSTGTTSILIPSSIKDQHVILKSSTLVFDTMRTMINSNQNYSYDFYLSTNLNRSCERQYKYFSFLFFHLYFL